VIFENIKVNFDKRSNICDKWDMLLQNVIACDEWEG